MNACLQARPHGPRPLRHFPVWTLAWALLPIFEAAAADPRVKGDDRKAAEWVLAKGGEVTISSRDKEVKLKTGQSLPPDAFQLVAVSLKNDAVATNKNPEDLSTLLGPKPVTAAELTVLAGLPKLERVYVQKVTASPEFFDTLKTLPKLRSLEWLGDNTMQDAHMVRFKELPPLGDLRLEMNESLTRAGMEVIVAAQPGLTSLNLKHGEYKDDVVPLLLKLRRLQVLEIPWTHITPGAISTLAALPDLQSLTLSGEQCTSGIDWSKFTKLTSMRLLFDEQVPIEETGLAHLAGCRKLELLQVEGDAAFSLAGMKTIGGLRSLRTLIFYTMTVPDGCWSYLTAMPKLESFKVSGVNPFTDRDLMTLAACRPLKKVIADKSAVTPGGVDAFRKKRSDVEVDASAAK